MFVVVCGRIPVRPMRRVSIWATPFLFCTMLAATACHAMHVRAEVTADSAPVEDAAVAMWCPQIPPTRGRILGRTNQDGLLEHREHPLGAWLHEDCAILVLKDGFESARYPVPDVCERWRMGYRCQIARVRADLQRRQSD